MRLTTKQRLDRVAGAPLLLALRPLARAAGVVAGRDHSPEPRGDILLLKMLGGGSLLLCLPALLGLRRRHPGRPLALLCGRGVEPFAKLAGVFESIHVIEDGAGAGPLAASTLRALGRIWRRPPDTVIDLEVYSQLTSVLSLVTCARNRIGFYLENTFWRRGLHTHLIFFNRAGGVHSFYGAVARLLGAEPVSSAEAGEHLARLAGQRLSGSDHEVLATVRALSPFVAVGAGCSEFGSVRVMPPPEWAAFVRQRGASLRAMPWVFLGGAADRELSEAIGRAVASVEGPAPFRFVNLCGALSLPGSFHLLGQAGSFLGIDSALLHAARLFRVPALSFWGPTSPATRLQPVEGLSETVFYRPPVCSPCLHVAESPPCKGQNVCMLHFTRDETPSGPWIENPDGLSVMAGPG